MPEKKVVFTPEKSVTTFDNLRLWLMSDIDGDLQQVPGVGPKAEDYLKKESVNNTWQLIAKFLSMYELGMSEQEHCNLFKQWLADHTKYVKTDAIVEAIVEYMKTRFPKLYPEDKLMKSTEEPIEETEEPESDD